MKKIYTETYVVEHLRTEIKSAGLRAIAELSGFSVAFLSAVATGKKKLSPKLADWLGYEPIQVQTTYSRKATR